MYVIGLNGPPEAGKDTIAKALAVVIERYSDLPIRIVSVVEPLARMGATLLGVKYSDEWYVANKSVPQSLFTDKATGKIDTLRQWMIEMVEKFYKPKYGRAFFSRVLLMQQLQDGFHGILIVTNIGFHYEIELFEGALGADYVCIVQVDRKGKNFDNDSRGPVTGTNTLHVFHGENDTYHAAYQLWNTIELNMRWNLK